MTERIENHQRPRIDIIQAAVILPAELNLELVIEADLEIMIETDQEIMVEVDQENIIEADQGIMIVQKADTEMIERVRAREMNLMIINVEVSVMIETEEVLALNIEEETVIAQGVDLEIVTEDNHTCSDLKGY